MSDCSDEESAPLIVEPVKKGKAIPKMKDCSDEESVALIIEPVKNGKTIPNDDEKSQSDDDVSSVSDKADVHGSKAEDYYKSKGGGTNLKVLFTMAIGMKRYNSDEPLLDLKGSMFQDPQFQSIVKIRDCKPTKGSMKDEVLRRAKIYGMQPPVVSKYSIKDFTHWLMKHPITSIHDVLFVTCSIVKFETEWKATKSSSETLSKGHPWTGDIAYLRLIFVIIDDKIKELFQERHVGKKNRSELDAINTDAADALTSFYKDAADKWNDPTFNPIASARPGLHDRFVNDIPLNHKLVEHLVPATAQKIFSVWRDMRAKLIHVQGDWGNSGEGDGDDKKKFLHKNPAYILYLWEIALEHGILESALQVLDEESAAPSASQAKSVCTVSALKQKKRESLNAGSNLVTVLGENTNKLLSHFEARMNERQEARVNVALEMAKLHREKENLDRVDRIEKDKEDRHERMVNTKLARLEHLENKYEGIDKRIDDYEDEMDGGNLQDHKVERLKRKLGELSEEKSSIANEIKVLKMELYETKK